LPQPLSSCGIKTDANGFDFSSTKKQFITLSPNLAIKSSAGKSYQNIDWTFYLCSRIVLLYLSQCSCRLKSNCKKRLQPFSGEADA